MRIISDIRSMATFEAVCQDELFLQKPQLQYKPYENSFFIQDLRNALKPGEQCVSYSLAYDKVKAWKDLLHEVDGDLAELLARLEEKASGAEIEDMKLARGITAHRRVEASIRTFSPFALERLKPLSSLPSKWTLAHVKKALANGQYEQLQCDGVYTDDYLRDNATNFRKGAIKPLHLLRELIETPSGWWSQINSEGKVDVGCHHFEYNSFVLKLENRAPALEPELLD